MSAIAPVTTVYVIVDADTPASIATISDGMLIPSLSLHCKRHTVHQK